MADRVVSVYGYGRFGRFWADLLAEDFTVQVYSRRGLRPDEVSPLVRVADEPEIFACDALFFCVAISAFEEVLQRSRRYSRPGTLFFDTCSVKVYPVRWMVGALPPGSRIIATHPMFGPDSYPGEKRDLPMVMANISATEAEFASWKRYFADKAMRVEEMTAEQHDEMTAYSQGITHYMGRVFHDLDLRPTRINTLGYEKLLEVMGQTCNDSWQLFLDLQNFNPFAWKMRNDLQASLMRINTALDRDRPAE